MRHGETWDAERAIYEAAEQNLGLFLAKQWAEAGLSFEQLATRRKKGSIVTVLPKVMALAGSPRSLEFKIRAGAMRAGPIASGYGISAAAKHGLLPADRLIHIATTRRMHNSNPEYVFHRVALDRVEIVEIDKAPVTDALRTMLDACGCMHPKRSAYMYQKAKRLKLFTDAEALERCTRESRQGRSGLIILRRHIETFSGDHTALRSGNESRFLDFLKRWEFPDPLINVPIDVGKPFPWTPDFFWPTLAPPLAVDMGEYFTHGDEEAYYRDIDKTNDLEVAGIRLVHVYPRMLDNEPQLASFLRRFF